MLVWIRGYGMVSIWPSVYAAFQVAVVNRDGIPHAQVEVRAGGISPSRCSKDPPTAFIFLWTHGGRCGSLGRLVAHSTNGDRLTHLMYMTTDVSTMYIRFTGHCHVGEPHGHLSELWRRCVARSCPSESPAMESHRAPFGFGQS